MAKSALTEEQQLFFETNGYLVIPEALSPEELARVRAAADRAEAVWRSDPTRLGLRKDNLQQVQSPIEYDDTLFYLLELPATFSLILEILANVVVHTSNDFCYINTHIHS